MWSCAGGFDAKQQPGRARVVLPDGERGARHEPDAVFERPRQQVGRTGAVGELQPAEHPAGRDGAGDRVAEHRRDGAGESGGALAQRRAQPVHVGGEPGLIGQQFGRDDLGEAGGAQVGALLESLDGPAELRRTDEPADPQCRGEHLRHAAQPHHALAAGGHRHRRRAVEGQQPVRVVLDDEETVAFGELSELCPPRSAERDAARVVEARHGVHQPRAQAGRQPVGEHVDGHAVGVHRHRVQRRPGGLEHLQRPDVHRVLDDHRVARVEHRPRHQVERLLRAAGHDHAVRHHGAPEPLRLVRRDHLAQAPQARGLAVLDGGRVGDGVGEGRADPLARQQVGAGQPTGQRDHLGAGGQREQIANG